MRVLKSYLKQKMFNVALPELWGVVEWRMAAGEACGDIGRNPTSNTESPSGGFA